MSLHIYIEPAPLPAICAPIHRILSSVEDPFSMLRHCYYHVIYKKIACFLIFCIIELNIGDHLCLKNHYKLVYDKKNHLEYKVM